MVAALRGVTVVLLPGTGSDDEYIHRAFCHPLHRAGAVPVAPVPEPAGLIAGYLTALDRAADRGPIAVGGVSLGAAVATAWALQHPDRTVGVLAALPAWTGDPATAPAGAAARHTAQLLRRDGLAATVTQMRATSPAWLADELTRSWTNQWPQLPDALEDAAGYTAPQLTELRRLSPPLGVAVATDDPVHPPAVGTEWAVAAPRAALHTVTLDQIGADPAALGCACLAALVDAAGEALNCP